jgi:hypothetical protein
MFGLAVMGRRAGGYGRVGSYFADLGGVFLAVWAGGFPGGLGRGLGGRFWAAVGRWTVMGGWAVMGAREVMGRRARGYGRVGG